MSPQRERDDVTSSGRRREPPRLSLGDDKLVQGRKLGREEVKNVLFWSHLSVINALASREGHRRLKITRR